MFLLYTAGKSAAAIGVGTISSGTKATSWSTTYYTYTFTATAAGYYVTTVCSTSNGGSLGVDWSTTGKKINSWSDAMDFTQNEGVERGTVVCGVVQTAIHYLEAGQSLSAGMSSRYADFEARARTARLTVG